MFSLCYRKVKWSLRTLIFYKLKINVESNLKYKYVVDQGQGPSRP